MIGFGTEKIEDELQLIFPDTIFKRMDLDSTRSKNAYEEIIDNFANVPDFRLEQAVLESHPLLVVTLISSLQVSWAIDELILGDDRG